MLLPKNGVTYKIFGDDCYGEWYQLATCVWYKDQKQHKGYRWINQVGDVVHKREVERWEEIC